MISSASDNLVISYKRAPPSARKWISMIIKSVRGSFLRTCGVFGSGSSCCCSSTAFRATYPAKTNACYRFVIPTATIVSRTISLSLLWLLYNFRLWSFSRKKSEETSYSASRGFPSSRTRPSFGTRPVWLMKQS